MAAEVAKKYAECPLCFEPLHAGSIGVFVDAAGKRVGPQFYRYEKAVEHMALCGNSPGGATCPVTNKAVADVKKVPSILDDPKTWFRLCDLDGNKKLSRSEVVEALKAQLPLDNKAIDRFAVDDGAWSMWDANGSGSIEYLEIMDEDKGLLGFVKQTFLRAAGEAAIPDIRKDRNAWYRYFDEDRSDSLCLEEVLRAFVKTFRIDLEKTAQLRESLSAVWCIFDTDGSGTVEKHEFLHPNEGLADTVIATLRLQ